MMDRKTALEKYEIAKNTKKVDKDIISILEIINATQEYYTTSSCSGRIGIMEIPRIGDKVNAKFLGKWHWEVNFEELIRTISNYKNGELFFLVQSAIIHVVAKDIEHATIILKISRNVGFKYSTIHDIKQQGTLVEVLSTENLNVPIGESGELLVDEKYLRFLLKQGNETLRRIKQKLYNLETELKTLFLSSS